MPRRFPSFLAPEIVPFVDIEIIPAHPHAPLQPVVEVELRPIQEGDVCSSWCGYCGACSSGPAPNAVCPACDTEFYKGRDDVGDLCDSCCSLRDALQERLTAIGLQAVKAALAKKAGAA
jgi:hypothetical protein